MLPLTGSLLLCWLTNIFSASYHYQPISSRRNSISFCCYLHHQFFNQQRLRAGHHKIPAQQQALNVIGNGYESFCIFGFVEQLLNIKTILQELKPELTQRYRVASIGLFGSIVRDDYTASSDIDILVDFSSPIGIEFIDLADYIEKKLNRKVDLVSRNAIKEKYFKAIEGEIIYV